MLSPMDRLRGLLAERGLPAPPVKLAEAEDGGILLYRTLRNATHLDVDEVDRRVRALLHEQPAAARHVHHEMDFSEATPADPDEEASLDVQEAWDGVRPTLHVALRGSPSAQELADVAALCAAYFAAVSKVFPPASRH